LGLYILCVVDPLVWFSSECLQRGMKVFSFQVMVWLLTMSENVQASLQKSGVQFMEPGLILLFQELEEKYMLISKQLTLSLAEELVDHAISGPEKVKNLLNSLCQLFGRPHVGDSILVAVREVYQRRTEKHEKLPCEAQVLANCGTAFISHKGSYLLGDFHVYIAQQFFKEAKCLLPTQVCTKQSNHLDKNIRIANLVPDIRRILLSVNENGQIADLQKAVAAVPFLNTRSSSELKDICSAIKFVLQMTVNGSDPHGLEKVVKTLRTLSMLFEHNKDLSKKCMEWASSASYKDSVTA